MTATTNIASREKEELQVKVTRTRYGSFFGTALVTEPAPSVMVLESFGRPTAVWIEDSGRLYLLHGWHATPSNTLHVREFASQKTGTDISDAAALREMIAEEDLIKEYPTAEHPARNDDPSSAGTVMDTQAIPQEDLELLDHLVAEYRDAAQTDMPGIEGSTRSKDKRDREPMTRFIEEWLNDISDPRADELVDAGFSTSGAQSLLRKEGLLDEGNAPTEKAEQMGLIGAAWRDKRYALYPRERFGEYRDLIYGLYQASKAEKEEQMTETAMQQPEA